MQKGTTVLNLSLDAKNLNLIPSFAMTIIQEQKAVTVPKLSLNTKLPYFMALFVGCTKMTLSFVWKRH